MSDPGQLQGSALRGKDIAMIGMAGIYPGAPTVGQFWRNILSKTDSITDAPPSWHADFFHDAGADAETNDRTYCKRGGFIDAYAEFDPMEFGIMPGSIDGSDPEQFLALRVAKAALGDAGYSVRPFDREHTAVIIGHGNYQHRGFTTTIGHVLAVPLIVKALRDTFPELSEATLSGIRKRMKQSLPAFTPDTTPGQVSNVIAGRIANRLDLMGPSYLVDAACASSLVAVNAGIGALRSGECAMVIAGGTQVNDNAIISIMFSMLGALSKSGRLRPFDKNADGTLLGEGVGMAVFKRLADAERDGDRIYAVLKSVGVSSDGKANSPFAPRLEGEIAAMRRAYEYAGVDPDSIELIEAHGTATPVGDRTEAQAMTAVFGEKKGCLRTRAVGSVKSMISHTIPASGMAGLFKTGLALYHKVLPPTLCDEPNPELGIEKTSLYINTETRPWIHGGDQPRRAGVSAFGFGGINTHAVLEEYVGNTAAGQGTMPVQEWDSEVFLITGGSPAELEQSAAGLLRFAETNPSVRLRDIAYTVNCCGPDRGKMRTLGIVADSVADLQSKLKTAIACLGDEAKLHHLDRSGIYCTERPLSGNGKLAFILPGEGSQYTGMLKDLCIHFPEVRRWFDRADRAWKDHREGILPSQAVFPHPHLSSDEQVVVEAASRDMSCAVTLLLTADSAILNLLLLLGLEPDAIAGHSTAQDLALEAAAFADDLKKEGANWRRVIENRMIHESVLADVPKARMMSVGAHDHSELISMVEKSGGRLHVAMDNCPNQVVICGNDEEIEKARGFLSERGAICQFLQLDRGYHTPLYLPVCRRLEDYAPIDYYAELKPRIAAYSTTTGVLFPDDPAEKMRLLIGQWAEPVRFRETIENMYKDGIRIFVEAGPRGNLTGFVSDTLSGREHLCVPADVMHRSGISQLHHLLASVASHGVNMNLSLLYDRRACRELSMVETGKGYEPAAGLRGTKMMLKYDVPLPVIDSDSRAEIRMSLAGFSIASGGQGGDGRRGASPGLKTERARLIEEHFKTMGEFLSTHGELMNSLAESGRKGRQ